MFNSPKLSLEDILGKEYVAKVVEANDALGTMDSAEGAKIGAEKIDFYPEAKQKKNSHSNGQIPPGCFRKSEAPSPAAAIQNPAALRSAVPKVPKSAASESSPPSAKLHSAQIPADP